MEPSLGIKFNSFYIGFYYLVIVQETLLRNWCLSLCSDVWIAISCFWSKLKYPSLSELLIYDCADGVKVQQWRWWYVKPATKVQLLESWISNWSQVQSPGLFSKKSAPCHDSLTKQKCLCSVVAPSRAILPVQASHLSCLTSQVIVMFHFGLRRKQFQKKICN